MSRPRDLDLLGAAALPAAKAATLDGWLLRHAPPGRPRRTNSALPPAGARDAPLRAIERWYADRGAVPYVQVTPAEEQGVLDAELAQDGWALEAPTDVLVASAATVRASLPPSSHRVDVAGTDGRVLLAAAGGAGGATVVLQEGWALLLDVEVAQARRRGGVGRALVRAAAGLAGERSLYLQVETANAPAQALYRAAGFTRSHGYHYRRSRRYSTSSKPIGSATNGSDDRAQPSRS